MNISNILGRKSKSLILGSCLSYLLVAWGCQKESLNHSDHAGISPVSVVSAKMDNVESSDLTVMDNNSDLIYLGSILDGRGILDNGEFNSVSSYSRLPITISCSTPGQNTSANIPVPRMSSFRQTIQNILRNNSYAGTQIGSFVYTYYPFYYYDEVARSFGYQFDSRGLFSSAKTTVMEDVTHVKKRNGFVASFMLENFTADMSLPRNTELLSASDQFQVLEAYPDAVYVNSVSFGQKGIMAIETDLDIQATSSAFSKVTKKIFKKTAETITSDEIHLINHCTIRLFLAGGPNGGSPKLVNGYYDFINYIGTLGEFSADNPGYPVSFRCRLIRDFSLFKTTLP